MATTAGRPGPHDLGLEDGDQVAVAHRLVADGEFQHAVEQQPTGAGATPVEAEDELVQVRLQVLRLLHGSETVGWLLRPSAGRLQRHRAAWPQLRADGVFKLRQGQRVWPSVAGRCRTWLTGGPVSTGCRGRRSTVRSWARQRRCCRRPSRRPLSGSTRRGPGRSAGCWTSTAGEDPIRG